MAVTWTQEQRRVIETRGCSLLVAAAAGSGKTAVLVERILAMLTDREHPIDIDRLLIVTFTNAAAGEMKDRIRAGIEQRLEGLGKSADEDEWLADHLQRQISLLSNAQICTIHSFCQYVIRNHFHTIDLEPSLRIADDGEQKLLQREVLEKLMNDSYEEGDEKFLSMAQSLAPGRDDSVLMDMALDLYQFSRSFPFPERWFAECKKAYELTPENMDEADWVKSLFALTTDILSDVEEQIGEAIGLAEAADGPYPYLDALYQDREIVEKLLESDSYTERSDRIRTLSWARLSAKRDQRISEEKKRQVKDLRDDYKQTLNELQAEFFPAPAQALASQMQKSAPVLGAMVDFTVQFARRYAEEKLKKNLMDFNDLEHFALKILVQESDDGPRPTAVAREFAEHYAEIMIDEYQDSNMVQEMILTSVSGIPDGVHNIFMVGDVKQSIYRFRLARPELFMEKYASYGDAGEERKIALHKNFRSRAQVLTGVNFLFRQLMEQKLGNVDYDEAAALYPGAEFAEGDDQAFRKTEVLLIDTDIPEEEEQPDETAREMEARAVADRIRRMAGTEKVWDKEAGAYRAVRYSDIVILLRTIQGWADVFARMLTDMGIPARTGSRTGYFSATEVQTVLSLLKIIDNPRQDIPMAAVLHSPVVGLSAEELARIRSSNPEVPFYEACMRESSLGEFFEMLSDFRRMAVYTPIHELLWYILERTGYGAYAAAMPGGVQRKANLDMLVEKAISYETGSYRGLYNFVRYIENLHKYDVDFGEASVSGQENAVHILSIHKSKGLEFPVVFVCGMGKQFNQADARSSLICHADLGIGCDCVDTELRTRSATLLKRLIRRQTVLENLGEELRVLYVAMTRAKEKLILTGTVSKTEERLRRWSAACRRKEPVLSFMQRARAVSFWDWLVPALARNRCFASLAQEYEIRQDESNPLYACDICCEIRLLHARELVCAEVERQKKIHMTEEELLSLSPDTVFDRDAAKKLEENLSFCYTYGRESNLPAKVSVSELKKMTGYEEQEDGEAFYEEPVPVPLIPEFLRQEENGISGAARGTIYHRLMECLDFTRFREEMDRADIAAEAKREIERLVQSGHLKEEEAPLIDIDKVVRFLEAPLGARMMRAARAGELYRERQFVLEIPAAKIRGDWQSQEGVLIQGIIDAYFVESGQIVLLDYKTDFVKMQEASSLYDKYAVQLEYYKTALEQLTHFTVKEQLIYSFCLNRVLRGPCGTK